MNSVNHSLDNQRLISDTYLIYQLHCLIVLSDFSSYTMMYFLFSSTALYLFDPNLLTTSLRVLTMDYTKFADATGKVALERISFWKEHFGTHLSLEQRYFTVLCKSIFLIHLFLFCGNRNAKYKNLSDNPEIW